MIQINLLLFFLLVGGTSGLFIEGCPLYGCRPSGTFSMYLNITRINVSLAWETSFGLDPFPKPLGCVANDVNIICQSNGPFKEDTGYVSLDAQTGTIHWRDKVLNFPTLPVLDNYGDVTGSDGTRLVHYDADGKLYPIIPCEGLNPLISLQLVGTDFLLLVSGSGLIVARETNGVPVGYIRLNYVKGGVNGTFIPISRPVVNGNRFYMLTKFASSFDTDDDSNLLRIFAFDIHHSLDNRITIAWYYDFLNLYGKSDDITEANKTNFSKSTRPYHRDEDMYQVLLWDNANNLVYVNLPQSIGNPESRPDTSTTCLFWALKDFGNHSSLMFCNEWDVKHMTKFEPNTDVKGKNFAPLKDQWLWLITSDGYLHALSSGGAVIKSVSLHTILGTTFNITSKVVLTKAENNGSETLIFAFETERLSPKLFAKLSKNSTSTFSNNASSFVVAIKTDVDVQSSDVILWMVPVPGNMRVRGQISGSSGAETQTRDKIIFYAETEKSAKIFAINWIFSRTVIQIMLMKSYYLD